MMKMPLADLLSFHQLSTSIPVSAFLPRVAHAIPTFTTKRIFIQPITPG